MKDQIINILNKYSTSLNDPVTGHERWVHECRWVAVMNEIDKLYNNDNNYSERKAVEVEFLEKYNRIKKHYCDKRGVKFVRARVVAKPSQLHARLKTYTMDELGTVIYNVFNDNFHVDTKWKYATTDYITRQPTIEKYLN